MFSGDMAEISDYRRDMSNAELTQEIVNYTRRAYGYGICAEDIAAELRISVKRARAAVSEWSDRRVARDTGGRLWAV